MTTQSRLPKDTHAKHGAPRALRWAILLACTTGIAGTGNAWSVEATMHSRVSPMQKATGPRSQIDRSTLTAIDGALVQTEVGSFRLDAETRLYLRNGGAIQRVDDLSRYMGSPVQLKTEDGRAVWIVVETREAIR